MGRMGPMGSLVPSQTRIGSSSTEAQGRGWTQSLIDGPMDCHMLPWPVYLCHRKGKKLLAKLEKEELDAVAREKPLK